jgi:5'-phosphate synthase pdxT subunit
MVTASFGVLAIQGAVAEHVTALQGALRDAGVKGRVSVIRQKKQIADIDALIIPGGESTTISKILHKSGMLDNVKERIQDNDLYIMGTCAGCTLLARKLVPHDEVQLLHAIDMQVERNAFGRQKESFEHDIEFNDFSYPYHAVFIRAPVIKKIWGDCKPLATIDKKIIAVRQDTFLALSFHPELTNDLRVHTYFLKMVV